jgi:hypothetical protein
VSLPRFFARADAVATSQKAPREGLPALKGARRRSPPTICATPRAGDSAVKTHKKGSSARARAHTRCRGPAVVETSRRGFRGGGPARGRRQSPPPPPRAAFGAAFVCRRARDAGARSGYATKAPATARDRRAALVAPSMQAGRRKRAASGRDAKRCGGGPAAPCRGK